MTQEQIIPTLARHEESLKTVHKRLDKVEETSKHIYKLAASIESLTIQLKHHGEQIERVLEGMKTQNERIGALEKEPARKWKALVEKVLTLVVAALIGGALSNLL